ncbi:MAG TPA: helix-turn-helix transcriptional regulator [Flavobacteriales bacterium]
MDRERTGRKIRAVRELRNYNQTYMAGRLGIGQNTYSLWEQGRGLDLARVTAIARLLDVSTESLTSPEPFVFVSGGLPAQDPDVPSARTMAELLRRNEERAQQLEVMNRRLMDLVASMVGEGKAR